MFTSCVGSDGSRLWAVFHSACSAPALGQRRVAAAKLGDRVGAIVSRGGRPDLAGDALDQIHVPTLLIVGGIDFGVIELNEQAFSRLRGPKSLEIVPGASHLFPEPGALEAVIDHAARWFERHLGRGLRPRAEPAPARN